MGVWRQGNIRKNIYKYNEKLHKNRMGHCDFLPNDGDLCICVEPAGDCFDRYVVVRKCDDGCYVMVGEFGAYAFGDSCGTVNDREFHLLQAGEQVRLINL
jgi:hypothetical protein